MNKIFSAKYLLAVLSIIILGLSIAIYATSPETILAYCTDRCEIFWDDVSLWLICVDGCLFHFTG